MSGTDEAPLSTYERFVAAAEEFLKRNQADSPDNAVSGSDIAKKVPAESGLDITEGTARQYLNRAATKDEESRIQSNGPWRGYWLSKVEPQPEPVQAEAKAEAEETIPATRTRIERERVLYSAIEKWLFVTGGYRGKDVSTLRSGGPWGNPDVAGLKVTDKFGFFDVEIASVEVKAAEDRWETLIFEAISHKRFANRSYYAYVVPQSAAGKLPEQIRRYAEQFRVGILHISLTEEEAKALREATTQEEVSAIQIDSDAVQEVYPAPYDFVPPANQIPFLEAIGIKERGDFHTWGRRD